jgi:oligopeptide transport system ATP-binding protein
LLLETHELKKYFAVRKGIFARAEKKMVRAVDGLNLNIRNEETLGLVGESGCGKSTTAKLLLRLLEPTAGTITFDGRDVWRMNKRRSKELSKHMQMVFQDPYASLNPRKTVRQILSKPFRIHTDLSSREIEQRVIELLESVGLGPVNLYIDRYPHEFSGGQRQRVGIARAIAVRPRFIAADEPVSALDMSIRAQILNLMKELKTQLQLTLLYVSHDLATVRSFTDRVAVMYLGKVVESAPTEELYVNPLHPYTKGIFAATPIPNPRVTRSRKRFIITGEVPSPIDPPSGCRFHSRCPYAMAKCPDEEPPFVRFEKDHFVACYLHS